MKYLSQFRSGTLHKTSFAEQIENALDELAREMENFLDIDAILKIARGH